MALPIQSPCFLNKPASSLLSFTTKKTRITVVTAKESQSEQQPTPAKSAAQDGSSLLTTPLEKPSNSNSNSKPGLGFGSSSSSSTSRQTRDNKKNQKGRERASVIRRSPVEKPTFLAQREERQSQEQSNNENAFLLTWLGLGVLILIEGIALAASGFLPEEWDKFFVKYLYPSFTPTVFLFVAGTVVYGVLKYLRGENSRS